VARRKVHRGPVAPAAATETGRFLVLMENLQSQVQALAEGQITLHHALTEMESRLRAELRNEASVLRAAIAQNSTDLQRLDRAVQRMDRKLDRKVERDEVAAIAGRVGALEHG
jgi:hypothetical protein